MVRFQTGDVAAIRYADPGIFKVGRLMGGVSDHNEMLRVGRSWETNTEVLYVRHPAAEYMPLAWRLCQHREGKLVMAIYRHEDLLVAVRRDSTIDRIAGAMDKTAQLRLPYDWTGPISIARNMLRHYLGLRDVVSQKEHLVWCTEDSVLTLKLVDVDALKGIPRQNLPAPIHIERAVRAGTWRLVADYGLHAMIMGRGEEGL